MPARLDIPQRIRLDRILITRHLLLLKAPLRELHLMRKQITPRQRMPQPKLGPQRPNLPPTQPIPPPHIPPLNLHDPVVVRVPDEPGHAVRGDLVLEVHVGDGRADVVRVEALLRGDVLELDAHVGVDGLERGGGVVEGGVPVERGVDDEPVVVVVDVRVEGYLLFWRTLLVS